MTLMNEDLITKLRKLYKLTQHSAINTAADELESLYTLIGHLTFKLEQAEANKPKTYNHAFSLAYSVQHSTHPQGEDVTVEQHVRAITTRLQELFDNNELLEAVGVPEETYIEE